MTESLRKITVTSANPISVSMSMSTSTSPRIQQIIDHERAIHRSLARFGIALAVITVALVVFAVRH